MKHVLLLTSLFITAISFSTLAQEKRISPMASTEAQIGDATVTINYSQPSKKGREIFGGLVPYDKVWRTGANEATVLKTDKDIMVEGQKLPAGNYALFTIPGKEEWTVILNSHHNQWGAYSYDSKKDVMRFTVQAEQLEEEVETLTIDISEDGTVSLKWDTSAIEFQLEDAE